MKSDRFLMRRVGTYLRYNRDNLKVNCFRNYTLEGEPLSTVKIICGKKNRVSIDFRINSITGKIVHANIFDIPSLFGSHIDYFTYYVKDLCEDIPSDDDNTIDFVINILLRW